MPARLQIRQAFARDMSGVTIIEAYPGEEFELLVEYENVGDVGPGYQRAHDADTSAVLINKWGERLENIYSLIGKGSHWAIWSGLIMGSKTFNIHVEVGHNTTIKDDERTLSVTISTTPPPPPPPPPPITPGTIVLTVSVYNVKNPTEKLADAIVTVNSAQKRTSTGGIVQFTAGDLNPTNPYNPWGGYVVRVEKEGWQKIERPISLQNITLEEIGLKPRFPIEIAVAGALGVAAVGGIAYYTLKKRGKQ